MKLAMGCDEAACALRDALKEHLQKMGHEVTDVGTFNDTPVLYPDIAVSVAKLITEGRCERGILLCGTGIGMAISANKVPGIRAAQCHDTFSAERASRSNDAQIITLGARVIGPELAKRIVETFLAAMFDGGTSAPKVAKIMAYERELRAS